MSIAAIARIVAAPDPPSSGTELRIEHEAGPRFPLPPLASFIGLLWVTNRVPVLGVNAEEVVVIGITPDVDGDRVEVIRATETIDVYPGMNLSLLRTVPVYDVGEAFKLRGPIDSEDGGTASVQTPQGFLQSYAGGDLAVDGQGWYLPFSSDEPGHYTAVWDRTDKAWFARYGAVT